MKKNFVICLSLIIAIVLCVPSVSILADNQAVQGFYTSDSVDGFFSGNYHDTFSRSSAASDFYKLSNSDISISDIFAFNSLDVGNITDDNFCSFLVRDGSNWYYYVFEFNSIKNMITYNNGYFVFFCPYGNDTNQQLNFNYYVYSDGSWSSAISSYCSVFNNQYRYYQIPAQTSSSTLSLLYIHNIEFVSHVGEFYAQGGTAQGIYIFEDIWLDYFDYSNQKQYTNYCPSNLPLWNGYNIIDPDALVSENNTNHLYLTGCDAGFTKPLSLNNLSSSGGGYVYFTYNFDDWINNHSGDYTLQCNSTFYINNFSTGSIVRRNLDVSGVSIFALSELGDFVDWQNLNTTFMGYPNQILTGNYIKGYVYSLTYNQFGILQERYAKAGAHTVGYWVVKFANMLPGVKITENNVNYQEYFNSVVPSRFDLKVSFKIIDNVSGEESGTYIKTFNMLTGVSNVVSNSIQDNENPYVPSDSDDLQLPSIGDGNNGYLIETGDNNQIVNLTTPDNIKLFIDNGFQNFLSWYETSADTAYATNRFWSSMGIFEDNPASELYSEYFGFLPDDFKTLIFSCAGIGIVGGAFCILRRRLH